MRFGSALLTAVGIRRRSWEYCLSSSGLALLVTFKYLTFVMRADNQGEGGILALLSLAFPESVNEAPKSRLTIAMIAVGLIGAALLYGDGVITPAISVLSAAEGLTVAAPWLALFSVP